MGEVLRCQRSRHAVTAAGSAYRDVRHSRSRVGADGGSGGGLRRLAWQVPAAGALAVLAVAALGLSPSTIPALFLAAAAPELTRIDLREHRLPNRLTLGGIAVGLVAAAVSWATSGVPPLVPLVAGAASAGLLLVLSLGGGIGMGDVKLAAAIGLASPSALVAVVAPLAAFLLGGVAATVVLVTRGRRRGARIAFGPYLLAGYVAALVLTLALALVGRA